MHIWILVFGQVIFNGVTLNGVSVPNFSETQLTTDCATEMLADWQAFGWANIEPLEEDPADTQVGDVCRTQLAFPSVALP